MTAPAAVWYCGTTKWSAVSIWVALTLTNPGTIRRQTAALGTLTVGNERVFVCISGIGVGTTGAAEPTWVLTKGAKTTDATVTWQECTGQAAVNGDNTNTPAWSNANVKNTAIAQGLIIRDVANTTYFICTTAGTAGNGAEPSWSTTAGTTTADNTVTWTSIGATSNFTTAWGAPAARFNAPLFSNANYVISGDTIYISNNHAETQSSLYSTAFPLATTLITNVICVNDTAAPPTSTATTATISTTGASNIALFGQGSGSYCFYIYGVGFSAGSGANLASIQYNKNVNGSSTLDTCSLTLGNTNASSVIELRDDSTFDTVAPLVANHINCTFIFGAVAQQILVQFGQMNIYGGSIALTGTAPSTLFNIPTTVGPGNILVRDCDISGVTGNLIAPSTTPASLTLENCKLGSGVTLATGSITIPNSFFGRLHNCDSTNTNYRFYTINFYGTSQQETSIIRTGGASDGTTPISWNIASTANTAFYAPFISEEITIWNDSTGVSKTATIEINSGGTLTNGDVYLEIEYLSSSSSPIASLVNNRKTDVLQSNVNITASTAAWGGSLAGSTTQKLQVSFTPQFKGPVKARIYVCKPSQTVYIDPYLTIV